MLHFTEDFPNVSTSWIFEMIYEYVHNMYCIYFMLFSFNKFKSLNNPVKQTKLKLTLVRSNILWILFPKIAINSDIKIVLMWELDTLVNFGKFFSINWFYIPFLSLFSTIICLCPINLADLTFDFCWIAVFVSSKCSKC